MKGKGRVSDKSDNQEGQETSQRRLPGRGRGQRGRVGAKTRVSVPELAGLVRHFPSLDPQEGVIMPGSQG